MLSTQRAAVNPRIRVGGEPSGASMVGVGADVRIGVAAREAAPAPREEATSSAEPPAWLAARATPKAGPVPLTAAPRRGSTGAAGGEQREVRLEAGRLSHALLQYLPDIDPTRRREAGRGYLAARSVNVAQGDQNAILDRALTVLDDPNLAVLFGPGSRAEVAIAAEFPRADAPPASFVGRIDRLAIAADHIVIADFKSGAPGPNNETPADYVLQLALYRQALAPLYPGRTVRAYIVWIDGPQSIEIRPEALTAAASAYFASAD